MARKKKSSRTFGAALIQGAVMKVIAHDLTPDNIRSVASYLESLPPR